MSSLTETIEKTRPKPSSDLHADRSGASELVNLACHSLTNYSVGMQPACRCYHRVSRACDFSNVLLRVRSLGLQRVSLCLRNSHADPASEGSHAAQCLGEQRIRERIFDMAESARRNSPDDADPFSFKNLWRRSRSYLCCRNRPRQTRYAHAAHMCSEPVLRRGLLTRHL